MEAVAHCNCRESTYCIEVGEEIHCCGSVQRKREERLNIQRWLQGRCRRTHQGWESRALACTTCMQKETESIQQAMWLAGEDKRQHAHKDTIKRQYWIKQIHFDLSKNDCISEKKHSWLSDRVGYNSLPAIALAFSLLWLELPYKPFIFMDNLEQQFSICLTSFETFS